jgi:hypothetical protein
MEGLPHVHSQLTNLIPKEVPPSEQDTPEFSWVESSSTLVRVKGAAIMENCWQFLAQFNTK